MKNIQYWLIGLIIILAAGYFSYKQIDQNGYERGRGSIGKDTVFIPGKVVVAYRDTAIHRHAVIRPPTQPQMAHNCDSCIVALDTTFTLGRSSVTLNSGDIIHKGIDINWDIAEKIITQIDTMKVFQTDTIRVVEDMPWYQTFTAGVAAGAVAVAGIVFLTK